MYSARFRRSDQECADSSMSRKLVSPFSYMYLMRSFVEAYWFDSVCIAPWRSSVVSAIFWFMASIC